MDATDRIDVGLSAVQGAASAGSALPAIQLSLYILLDMGRGARAKVTRESSE